MSFQIRRARPGDEAGIHEAHMRSIREVCIRDHGEEEVRGWGNRALGDRWTAAIRDACVWVVEDDAAIRGQAYLRVTGEEAYVHGLYLTPEALGQGLGKRLLELLLEDARAAGVVRVTLDSTITAHDFYRRHGFTDTGPPARHDIGGSLVTAFPMELYMR